MPKKGDSPEKDYEVGYGKPPKGRRFEKGKSGNAKGRPPKPPPPSGTVEALRRALGQMVEATIGRRKRKMPMMEALAQQATKAAAGGNYAPMTSLARLNKALEPPPKTQGEKELEDAESRREIVIFIDNVEIAKFLERIGLVKQDKFGRPYLVNRSIARLFPRGFDPAKRKKLTDDYLRRLAIRSPADLIPPKPDK
jgi:hypothetical protein